MDIIKLQADNGRYVVAHLENGQKSLRATGDRPYEALELEFTAVHGFGTNKALRIQFNKGDEHLTLHGETLVLDGTGAQEFRDFEVLWLSTNEIALRGANGKFVSRETDGRAQLKANRDFIGPWEHFTIVP